MTCLKKDQIGKGLSRVIANYERPVYKEIGINFNGTLCCPFTPRYRDRSALHNVLVRRFSYDVFLYHDLDRGSSLQRNVTNSVSADLSRRTAYRSSGSADRITNAPETRRRPIGSWPFPLTSLAASRLGRISDAIRNGN